MRQFSSTIVSISPLSPDYYELTFLWVKGEVPLPGQFFTVSGWPGTDPLLRRPFAFSDFDPDKNTASMIFQLRGKATRFISTLKEGMELNFLGPLGNSFPEKEDPPVLIGGGIGTGPVVFMANELARSGRNPLLVLGFRNTTYIPKLKLEPQVNLVITTDDGSLGFHGNVVEYLYTIKDFKGVLYACGPLPMLKACHYFAEGKDTTCYVSMEEMMACGIGACQGCAVEVTLPQKYLRVCKEGTVFNSRIIKWN